MPYNLVVPRVVAKSHSANFLLLVEWIVNLWIRDFFPPSDWDFFPARFAGLGKSSFGLGRFVAAWKAAA